VDILVLSVPDIGDQGSVTISIFACPEVRTVWMYNLTQNLQCTK